MQEAKRKPIPTRSVLFTVSALTLILGAGMVCAIVVGVARGDALEELRGFLASAGICLAACLVCAALSRLPWGINRVRSSMRYGFSTISLAWGSSILLGALPFTLCCRLLPADALFETASGLSTTGATILQPGIPLLGGGILADGLAGLPQAILFWRQLLIWFGGIGFVMFALLLLPALGGGRQLYNAEVPGMKSIYDQMMPRIASTARVILGCYVLWTLLVTLAYKLAGMDSLYDAICHAFATVATGGFSPYPENFQHFPQPAVQWVCIAAMLFSSLNLVLMARLLLKHQFVYHKDEETRTFLCLFLLLTAFFAWKLHSASTAQLVSLDGTPVPHGWNALLRTAAFHVSALMSSTGFTTADFSQWTMVPGLGILVVMMSLVGGCGGSTSGGMKMGRVIVMLKHGVSEVRRRIFPHLVPNVLLNGKRLDMPSVNQCTAFFALYMATIAGSTLLLAFLCPPGTSTESLLSAVVSCVSNTGPGLGAVSPAHTFALFPAPAKLLMAFDMVAGRLELYTAFVILLPSFWGRKSQ